MYTSMASSGWLVPHSTGAAYNEPLAATGHHLERSHAGAATMLLAQPQSTLRPQNDDIRSDHAAPAASCASSALSMKAGSV